MKRSKTMEFGVGFIYAGGDCWADFVGLRVSGLSLASSSETFHLDAYFSNIGGLKPGSRVTMAGVTVGRVESIDLDTDWFDARVTLRLDSDLEGQLSEEQQPPF